MIDFYRKPRYDFADLVALVKVLRDPQGCPWDRVQTHESIRRNFIEEVYEACDAIDRKDPVNLQEELGDVLLHVVFHASIEEDAGRFDVDDVCDGVVKKMISRHPDLFGGETGLSWDELKRREKGQKTPYEELDAVARSLPALWRAEKLQKKAVKAGETSGGSAALLLAEAQDALLRDSDKNAAVGELLFAAVAYARAYGVDPEDALNARCEAFLAEVRSEGCESQNNEPIEAIKRRSNEHEQN
jgi:tetrapyrrole methylase family protein/MazG family protein